jgi:heme/copper-type cytochrome/quinol oxidase subunit 3
LAELAALNPEDYQAYLAAVGPNYEPTNAVMLADIRVSSSTFYVTTGTHGAHVFIGIIGLTYMTWKAWTGGYTPQNAVSIEYFGLYWHFVDLIWVIVFPFFYLY